MKLFKAGVPQRVAWHEARLTRAVFAAGFPAPEVLGEVTLEGRFGIVLPRLDKTPPPPEVLSLHDWMDGSLRDSGGRIPK